MPYLFICEEGHTSHSAARDPRDPSCPTCGKTTTLVPDEKDIRQILRPELEIATEMNIWHPGPDYQGREGDYAKTVGELPDGETIALVQKRAEEDSLWAIENGYASDTELMGRMAEWVGEPKNIAQCLEHIYSEENAHIRTVDWVCRELAQVTQSIARGEARD